MKSVGGRPVAQCAPASERNRGPILAVLRRFLPPQGLVLEIASGTGQHAAAFAAAFPKLSWQPSDPSQAARASIAAWKDETGLANLRPPLDIDVCRLDWDLEITEPVCAVLCINMIHIAPWAACEGLLRGAGRLLAEGGVLYLYGPYRRDNAHTAPSNAEFDRALRAENPAWGVRDLETVVAQAGANGLILTEIVPMPANNFSLIFTR